MPSRIGIIASPETSGVYRHAILAGFLIDADIAEAHPPASRIAPALLIWERAGVTAAVVDEGSYPGGVADAIREHLSVSTGSMAVILSAARARRAGDPEIATLLEDGLFGAVGAWTARPAAELKQLLTEAIGMAGDARPRAGQRAQRNGTTDDRSTVAGGVDEETVFSCMAAGAYDGCIARLKRGGICDAASCPMLGAGQPPAIYDEPSEPTALAIPDRPGALRARGGETVQDGDADWEEIVAEAVEECSGESAWIVRDLILWCASTQPEGALPAGSTAPAEDSTPSASPGAPTANRPSIRHRLSRALAIAEDIVIAVIVSLAASFILTMLLNPELGSFEVLGLFKERTLDFFRFLGLLS